MAIPNEFEWYCNAAFLAMKYEGATPDNCFQFAEREMKSETREIVAHFLDEVASDNIEMHAVEAKLGEWAHRFGLVVEGDLRGFLNLARAAVAR